MTSFVYDSLVEDWARGAIDFDTDAFRVMLCTAAYRPSKAGHMRRSDVVGEVVANGYMQGGSPVLVTVSKDTVRHQTNISLGGSLWPISTITARSAVYFKDRGGIAALEELVAVIDFGENIDSLIGTFELTPSALIVHNSDNGRN